MKLSQFVIKLRTYANRYAISDQPNFKSLRDYANDTEYAYAKGHMDGQTEFARELLKDATCVEWKPRQSRTPDPVWTESEWTEIALKALEEKHGVEG